MSRVTRINQNFELINNQGIWRENSLNKLVIVWVEYIASQYIIIHVTCHFHGSPAWRVLAIPILVGYIPWKIARQFHFNLICTGYVSTNGVLWIHCIYKCSVDKQVIISDPVLGFRKSIYIYIYYFRNIFMTCLPNAYENIRNTAILRHFLLLCFSCNLSANWYQNHSNSMGYM